MKNPHIIVGEPRRCLCGMYDVTEGPLRGRGKQAISCADVFKAIDDSKVNRSHQTQPFLLDAVIRPLVQECDDAPTDAPFRNG